MSLLTLNQHSDGRPQRLGTPSRAARTTSASARTTSRRRRRASTATILFTNEEAQDYVFRNGGRRWADAHPAGTTGAEQIGVVVALDAEDRQAQDDLRHGPAQPRERRRGSRIRRPRRALRRRHVLTTPVTTLPRPQSLTSDTRASSQLYTYIAPDTDALWADEGDLWAFVSDTPGVQGLLRLRPRRRDRGLGHFIKVPKTIATGKKADGSELTRRRTSRRMLRCRPARLRDPGRAAVGARPVGQRGNNSYGKNVFRLRPHRGHRVRQAAGMSNVVYLADSGRATAGRTGGRASRRTGASGRWCFDRATTQAKLSILVDGDTVATAARRRRRTDAQGEIHQPDNVETTANSLLVTEDPSSATARSRPDRATRARRPRGSGGTASRPARKVVAATVDQAADVEPDRRSTRPTPREHRARGSRAASSTRRRSSGRARSSSTSRRTRSGSRRRPVTGRRRATSVRTARSSARAGSSCAQDPGRVVAR